MSHCARFNIELPPDPVPVRAADKQVIQLVVNLLLNALEALSPDGEMSNQVNLTVAPRPDQGQVLLRVEDTGHGIPRDRLDRIFAPFLSGRDPPGVGLGLTICKEIAQDLGGAIAVESTPGQGSCFTVTLPAAAEPAGPR